MIEQVVAVERHDKCANERLQRRLVDQLTRHPVVRNPHDCTAAQVVDKPVIHVLGSRVGVHLHAGGEYDLGQHGGVVAVQVGRADEGLVGEARIHHPEDTLSDRVVAHVDQEVAIEARVKQRLHVGRF